MSGIINKVKEAVSGHSHDNTTGTTHTTGPHGTTHGTHGTHGTHNTTAGPHSSDMANKMDPRVDSDRDGSNALGGAGHSTHTTGGLTGTGHSSHTHGTGLTGTTHGTHNTTAGPHSSDMANKLDPRVDSDRDGSNTLGNTGHSTHTTGGLTGTGHSSHTHGTGLTGTTHGTHNTTSGPHSSDMANKMDPRVDSDRDGSNTLGNTGHSHGHTMGTAGHGHTAGPHSSDMANKMDPRVDSDRDGSNTMGGAGAGYGTTHTGTHGTHGTHNTTGTHGVHGAHGAHGGPGPAPNTAGPHKSDMLNKLDPRVDSDLDGSKTMGQDKTFASNVDTHDASQVPPSQFQKPLGHHTATQGSRTGSV